MKEFPWIFTGDSVLAIDAKEKTQTRRVVTLNNSLIDGYAHRGKEWQAWWDALDFDNVRPYVGSLHVCHPPRGIWHTITPRVQPGDVVWIKEAWAAHRDFDKDPPRMTGRDGPLWYRADGTALFPKICGKWRSPMFMPKWACRKRLRVTDVRGERVQDISADDARAEGPPDVLTDVWPTVTRFHPVLAFEAHWNSINQKRGFGWAENNWVWPYSFEVIEKLNPRLEA